MQDFLQQLLAKLVEPRSLRFLLVGILSAIANVLILVVLIDFWHWDTMFWRSLANIVATEICLLICFFAYRQFVWQIPDFEWQTVLRNELPTYHLSIASVIAIRSFLLFPVMDWMGIDPVVNTVIGVGTGAVLTYTLSDKFIFTAKIPIS
ncbi:MAG: hypothetical protein DCF19_21760 [Pseudanabaena frigida]|uniref:GtrA/DPMS transmembrane domain-containing protein n=1 Tax=Pseudanabaena frigida TaxID=945775 RepID=A0A2W4XPA7_9CYAN|nr:MAG: hypothetical protein DCF19_21760 [Pseudanabaena frigida]